MSETNETEERRRAACVIRHRENIPVQDNTLFQEPACLISFVGQGRRQFLRAP